MLQSMGSQRVRHDWVTEQQKLDKLILKYIQEVKGPKFIGKKKIKTPRETQKSKMAVWGGLTNSYEKKRSKQQRKGKIYPFECRVPKNSTERESLPQ